MLECVSRKTSKSTNKHSLRRLGNRAMASAGDGLGLLLLRLVALVLVVVDGGLLVLLVLGDQVVHVGLCLRELHLVHALAGVPVEERLAPEHRGELLGDALESS